MATDVRFRVVSSKEIASCPLHILSAHHYISEHKTEECDTRKRAELKRRLDELRLARQREEADLVERNRKAAEQLALEIRHSSNTQKEG
jgi:hypothetical protein